MTEPETKFELAGKAIKTLLEKPDNDTLLELYALYKQGSAGDVSGEKPGLFDFVAGAKYSAWEQLRGLSPESARQKYIELVEKLAGPLDK